MATPERLIPKGTLKGHTDIVTAIATPIGNSDQIVTSSRDKSLMIWRLTPENTSSYTPIDASTAYGYSYRRLTGHSHFVQDVVLSSDGQFALSASWDSELRLWDLQTSKSTRRFVGHRKDVLSVSFSGDNRQIVSGSRDRTMKLWNTLGECKFTFTGPESHVDWISAVRFSPVHPVLVSGSWDKTVKLWDLTSLKHITTLYGHDGYVNTVAVSPDGSLCVSGGKDGVVMLWDLGEGKRLYKLNAGSIIHALCFSPTRYWLCAATEKCVVVWDLENEKVVQELFSGLHEEGLPAPSIPPLATDGPAAYLPPPPPSMRRKNERIFCTSLNWSTDGSTLFTGYTDGVIRVWGFANNPYM